MPDEDFSAEVYIPSSGHATRLWQSGLKIVDCETGGFTTQQPLTLLCQLEFPNLGPCVFMGVTAEFEGGETKIERLYKCKFVPKLK